MKKPLLITFVLASTLASAQMTTANEPVIGDLETLFVVDSFATNYSGVTGTGVTWDYSTIQGYNGSTSDVEVKDPAGEPFTTDFPGATKVISVGGTFNTYLSSTASERVSQGFHLEEASLGDVLAKYGNDQLITLTYPFDFGSTISDTYDGNLELTFNGFPVNEALTGTANSQIDGTGTLLYPDGSSATGVIRYHSLDSAVTTLPIIGAVDVIRDQYEYYDYSVSDLPVFMHISIIIVQSGATTPVSELNLVLSKYDGTNSINELAEINFSIAPNPAQDEVTVIGEFSSDATAQLTDQSGRVLSTFDVQNGQSVDLSGMASGLYLITIQDGGVATTKTIVKK